MATFNGKKFLEAQIESILQQEYVEIEIDVLDDGSTDGTLEMLEEMLLMGKIHSLHKSNHIGPTEAFFKLLVQAEQADFYAFSDQDDIWLPSKLRAQVAFITDSFPTLVICNRRCFDKSGKSLQKREIKKFSPSWENALVQNLAFGNTQVFNHALLEVVRNHLAKIQHYDSYIYLLASLFGNTVLVPQELVLYRLHANNSIGIKPRKFATMIINAKNFVNQVQAIVDSFEKIPNKRVLLNHIRAVNDPYLIRRVYYSWTSPAHRYPWFENYLWRICAPGLKYFFKS